MHLSAHLSLVYIVHYYFSPQKIGHKRILLFTNADDPHAGNIASQRQAKQKAKDLSDIGIDIELMHMTRPGKGFELSKFYQVSCCLYHCTHHISLYPSFLSLGDI